MKIELTKRYVKDYKKLSTDQKNRVTNALILFEQNPYDPQLRNHKLKGKQKQLRSISAGFDLRIIYRAEGDHVIVYMLQVGRHEQVYE